MSSLRALKRRLTTVKNTAQITKAMQLISASKMKEAENLALQTVPYTQILSEIVQKLGEIKQYSSPLFRKTEHIKKILFLVIGPSRGFVGGLTSSLLLEINKNLKEIKNKYPGVIIEGISIHKMGFKILNNLGLPIKYHFSEYLAKPTTTQLEPIYKVILDGFSSEEFDEVYLGYMHFINTMIQIPLFKKILPISVDKETFATENPTNNIDFLFEPDKEEIFNFIIPEHFESEILAAILDSNASEESARMIAMKNATDNAKQLSKTLNLKYNRTRQSNITNELLEIAMGSN